MFTQTKFHNHHHLQNLHVFGCPVYVLDPTLQDAKKLPKWNRRSRRAVYLGYSSQHSNNVHLVLNLETGKISPQYHLVFDDTFSTVYSDGAFDADVWNSLVTSNLELHDNAPSQLPSSFEFIDTPSNGGRESGPISDQEADVLSFIDNLPLTSDLPPSTIFCSQWSCLYVPLSPHYKSVSAIPSYRGRQTIFVSRGSLHSTLLG
jgi:hypothetical protein